MKSEKTCSTCRWSVPSDWYRAAESCHNRESPNWAQFTIQEDTCEVWEGKEEHHAE